MVAKNRFSVSFSDDEIGLLERLSTHSHKSKAELVRSIVSKFISENPEAFRRKTDVAVKRTKSILLASEEK